MISRSRPMNGDSRASVILVVDDDPDILEALTEILADEGFEVLAARHGEEALAHFATRPPDLVLLDLMMPVMDGWEFASRMRKNPDWASVPILVLSADRNGGGKAREMGAIGYLRRPLEFSALWDVANTWLNSRARAKAGRSGPASACRRLGPPIRST